MWWKNKMGNGQSTPANAYNGPYFGGHYRGDFSIRRGRPDVNKPLPPPPPSKTVRFGTAPPAWEFYRDAPSSDNTANTRYCPSSASSQSSSQHGRPPPPYSSPTNTTPAQGAFYVVNR